MAVDECEGSRPCKRFVYRCTHVRCLRVRPGQRSGVVLSETGSDHLHVIADEVSRVAVLCIGQGNPTRFRGVRGGLTWLLRRVLLIRRLLLRDGSVKQTWFPFLTSLEVSPFF